MQHRLSSSDSHLGSQPFGSGQELSVVQRLAAVDSLVESAVESRMTLPKSSGILVGRGEGLGEDRVIGSSGDRVIGNRSVGGGPTSGLEPEARYAYYRRCQQFRRNGEQCKAPAMKGEAICYRHAEQADMEQRREQQRREILSQPGVGLGSIREAQRTMSELVRAILAGRIDSKAAGRLLIEIQNAIHGDSRGR